jgi:hypothetical protein
MLAGKLLAAVTPDAQVLGKEAEASGIDGEKINNQHTKIKLGR